MIELESILLLVGIGLGAGFASGLIGIGGGLFYIIVYSFYLSKLGIDNEQEFVRMVIINSILSTFFAALAGSIKQYKTGDFHKKPVILIGLAGLFSSILLTIFIKNSTFYNKKIFAIVFTIAILPLIWKMITKPKNSKQNLLDLKPFHFLLVGFISGTGTGLSGLGGSFITTPLLNGFFKVEIKKVISVALGVIVIVAGGTTLFNLGYQTFDTNIPYTYKGIHLPMVLPVILSVMITAPLGVKASKKLPARVTRGLFLAFCGIIIIRNILEIF